MGVLEMSQRQHSLNGFPAFSRAIRISKRLFRFSQNSAVQRNEQVTNSTACLPPYLDGFAVPAGL